MHIIFEIGKLLTALASPLTLSVFVLLYTGLSRQRISRFACLAAALLLLFFSSGFGSRLLLRSLESRYQGTTLHLAPTAPAIVVLGGGLANNNGPYGAIQLGQHAERLWMAAELYHAGKSPLILVSGGSGTPTVPEASLAPGILQAWGIPASAILTEEESWDTHQNAVFSQRILARKGIDRILLVTSAFHMPRASATFRRTGLAVFPVPADYLAGDDGLGFLLSLLPNAGALADSGIAIKEWLGIATYRVRDWAT